MSIPGAAARTAGVAARPRPAHNASPDRSAALGRPRLRLTGGGLEVSHATVGFRCVVTVRGEVDVATAGTLDAALETVVHSGERDIWVDLTDVTFFESS